MRSNNIWILNNSHIRILVENYQRLITDVGFIDSIPKGYNLPGNTHFSCLELEYSRTDRICMMEYVKRAVGYLYVNYSHTNNCYSYVELISKKVNFKKSSIKILLLLHIQEYSCTDRTYTTEYI